MFCGVNPIDLCFFRDLILDCFQAAQFPSSPHLSSVSHKSMWCNCINSLSHSSGPAAEYSQSESVSLWPVNLNPLIPTTGLWKFYSGPLNLSVCRVSFIDVSRVVFPSGGVVEVIFLTAGTDCLHLANTLKAQQIKSHFSECFLCWAKHDFSWRPPACGSLGLSKECSLKHSCIFTRLYHGKCPTRFFHISVHPGFLWGVTHLQDISSKDIFQLLVLEASSLEWTCVERSVC